MKILISGASGFVGNYLYHRLSNNGFICYKLIREKKLNEREIFWDPYNNIIDLELLKGFDTFIHLSGANIAESFWTEKRKKILTESRIKTTKFLSESIVNLNDNSKRLFIASAIGYYGPITHNITTEKGQKGIGFLASLCEKWENSAQPAISYGIKTIFMRFGIIMGKEGGFLYRLLKLYRLGLGGTIGNKNAFLSWIAIEDLYNAVSFLLNKNQSEGPYNFVSPYPITQEEFCHILSKATKRHAFFRVPSFFIKTFLGEMGRELFLADQKIYPEKLINEGFIFSFPYFKQYLESLLNSTYKI